jgi:hypothetical protein
MAGGMDRLRQDRNGLALVRISFCSLALLTCAPSFLVLSFPLVSFLSLSLICF